MLTNYAKIALRNLLRHKGYMMLNIAGLAVGMAACMIIVLFVRHEYNFDRYHDNAEQIYRVVMDRTSGPEVIPWARTPAPLGPLLAESFPEVRAAVRFRKNPRTDLVEYADKQFYEERFYFADPGVFDVFSFSLKRGDPATALQEPQSVVLTEAMARKYFGEEDPLGKVMRFDDTMDLTVTGILEEIPNTSHFVFDFLASFESLKQTIGEDRLSTWAWIDHHTYLLLEPEVDAQGLEQKMADWLETSVPEGFSSRSALFLQPLTRIHLYSKLKDEITPNSDAMYSYILATVAAFILLIACINFMNLATARSARRAREVGMRKVLGANRGQVIRQFLGESMLLTVAAFLLALVLVWLLLPAFNNLAETSLSVRRDLGFAAPVFLGLALVVGLLSGSYPAFFLSAAQPARVLKASFGADTRGRLVRKVLVVGQFAISILLIIGTLVIADQLDYFQRTAMGFDEAQVVVIPVRDRAAMREQAEALKERLKENPSVLSVSMASSIPGTESHMTFEFHPDGATEGLPLPTFLVDLDFVETYDLDVVAGRSLSRERATDSTRALLLNEEAVRHLGFANPLGERLDFGDPYTVVGVVKDFQFKSLHNPIEPLVLVPAGFYRYVAVKISPSDIPQTIDHLQSVWGAFYPGRPLEFSFLDETIDRQYRAEASLGAVFSYFALLAILIACLGLFGLASFTAERRTREIGIRKVMGATAHGLVVLVSREFLLLVSVSFLVASPLAYLAMDRWLSGFAFRVDLGPGPFLLAGGAAFLIALLTVSYQALRAAQTDPVKALRYE